MRDVIWLIPALPLATAVFLMFAGKRLGEPVAGVLATVATFGSFVLSVAAFAHMVSLDAHDRVLMQRLFTWVPAGDFSVDMGFLLDPLAMTMTLFVTGVGSLIHLYAVGYMHGDPRFHQFFVYLNLFVASMLLLVLGDNMLLTFLGWEGVGACSYLLISFWFEDPANASAGKKAFVTNRIGDWGFMVAMFLTFTSFGTLRYAEVLTGASGLAETTATAIALLLFIGAIGKSAQIPLFVWLPDAMAGPTPVSALIHAATMVTAGVFLLVRVNPILAAAADWVPMLIAVVGAATALLAATIAVAQNDIKKVLAYSTVSQLGFLFLAVGSGAYVAAIFHMITHAFFKALLFLGAGSVIHGMGDEQDLRRMGGLAKFMPITAVTCIAGWLAIAGVPPFSGFWSKDEILLGAWELSPVLWAVGLVTALLTAFYMSRQVFLTFFGSPRWTLVGEGDDAIDPAEGMPGDELPAPKDAGFHPHESTWTMTAPLVVLAVLAFVAGGINLPFTKDLHFLGHFLEPSLFGNEHHVTAGTSTKVGLAVAAMVAAGLGIAAAAAVYLARRMQPDALEQGVLRRGWYIDSSITWFMGTVGTAAFDALAWFDRVVIDGTVNGVGAVVQAVGAEGRALQSGYVRAYAVTMGLGAVGVLALLLARVVA